MRRFLSISLLLVGTFVCGMIVEEVPNPQVTAGRFVEDAGGVLGPDYLSLINEVCRELELKTTVEMAVVTIDDLGGTSVEDFAERLFQRFGIGKKGKDNGVLILFARDDRRIKFEVGYGLEGILTDALTSRFFETYAIQRFKAGEYGRGLYDLAKVTAETVAQEAGIALAIAEPSAWPAQVTPPPPKEKPLTERVAARARTGTPIWYYLAAMAALVVFGVGVLFLRVRLPRAKAAKEEALGRGYFLPSLVWGAGGIAAITIGGIMERFLEPILGYLGSAGLATWSQIASRKALKRYIQNYRLGCPGCREAMHLVSESADDRYLSQEEVAEEKAGGINYEFWYCEKCEKTERLEVKLEKAQRCSKCKRRTLTSSRTVLEAATTSHSGKEKIDFSCQNPKCGHSYHEIRTIPRKSEPSSIRESSGSSSSSSGSFGGGRSGGGGASAGW